VLMKELVDVVIVDCSSYIKSPLTEVALMKADAVVRMVTPTANSISFFLPSCQYSTIQNISAISTLFV
jgi:MinD-like ATPase involved in chromosome partitioning or flagellar assembly